MIAGRLLVSLAAAAAGLGAAEPADAALRFRPCGAKLQCAQLTVPLDRAGAVPGRVRLAVTRIRAKRPARGTTLLLAGGPGQAAISGYGPPYGDSQALAPRNDLVVFDQRGTGLSGLLRCRDLEEANTIDAGREAAACATLLGRRRGLYRTSESVDDIEALRRQLGGGRLTILGVSYGTYVAQAYAARYPQGVARLVLDSVVDSPGVDPLYRDTFAAVPRVLRELCRRGCREFTRNAVADTSRLVGRLVAAPLRGTVVGNRGLERPAALTRQDLLYTLVSGDLDFISRSEYPAAVVSALRGDAAPLLKLKWRAGQSESGGSPASLSSAVLAAALCEEVAFPWDRQGTQGERMAAISGAASLVPNGVFAPFDRETAIGNDLVRLCRRWPTASPAPASVGPLPDVPALLIEGSADLRTPIETARRTVGRLPRGRLLVAAETGHSALSTDVSECTARAARRFLAGRTVPRRCAESGLLYSPTSPWPERLSQVPRARDVPGLRGRVVGAVGVTIGYLVQEAFSAFISDFDLLVSGRAVNRGGLRGGRFTLGRDRLRLERMEVVSGVRVSGGGGDSPTGGAELILRVGGPAGPGGVLRMGEDGVLNGRLGGRPVRSRLLAGLFAKEDDVSASRAAGPAAARLLRALLGGRDLSTAARRILGR